MKPRVLVLMEILLRCKHESVDLFVLLLRKNFDDSLHHVLSSLIMMRHLCLKRRFDWWVFALLLLLN